MRADKFSFTLSVPRDECLVFISHVVSPLLVERVCVVHLYCTAAAAIVEERYSFYGPFVRAFSNTPTTAHMMILAGHG